MLKGFKDFILRGNVIELAVAVIIGSAFTAIVTAVTDSLIQPLINSFGSADYSGLGFQITDNESNFMDFGAVLTAAINFLIIAAVVYFLIVMPINKITEAAKRRQGVDPEEPAPTTEQLLTEIRDLMEAQKVATSPNSVAGDTTVDPDSPGRHQA
ncbi:TPA: large-conductance mechanosensitive channel protein MscL [Corynebacterium striatum]|uniref:large-conductance mechanosensitive channel protein MscL n=1 Tax=Corynebacterium striatum TaxID=43770 RepID=UPI000673D130|nr:large-conductance mechanosensitive channel protein MscL [Corynebacterium striatum]EGT5591302.1 large-conductance mechanosensitive channel protein MscL [Corynebacterium striatum]MDK8881835.1 large-conductance mechanosensitive channel protein MscL [Corynebacterium striatum]QRP18562.1 large-conductance mechanosensitive channel protein MscL [Corynebacterium striatum]CQD14274.1 Large-conductance mechanosensitive channel [Corynebacterium striatum]HAT1136944.1 large-conductance mechanosensitive ch